MRTMPYVAAAILVVAGAGTVHADEQAKDKDKAKEKEKEKDAKAEEPLSIAGRVFSRFVLSSVESEPWEGEVKLDSARVTVNYVWKEKVRTKIAIEAAGGVDVKDAFLDLAAGHGVSVRAGYFKVPISAIENASAWTLPTIDRGVVADILEDGLTLTGRRDAVQATWEASVRGPRVIATASQSMTTEGRDPARLLSDGAGLAAALRLEQDFCPKIRVGVVGSTRETIAGATVDRYWAAGADVELDLEDAGLGLRLWGDALAGDSHFGTFTAAQVAAGWRVGGEKRNKPYVEPFVLASYFNPSVDRKRDDVNEVAVGVSGGRWKRWRGQAQFSYVNAKGFRPPSLTGALSDVNDALTVTLQLGAAF